MVAIAKVGSGSSGVAIVNSAASSAILDKIMQQVAAAYSPSQKLKGNFLGSALRVRRSSDNLEADIGFLSNGDLDVYALMNHVGAENQLTFSEQFDNAAWNKINATITPNATLAPDGTVTADTITNNVASSNFARVVQTLVVTNAATYTTSVFMRAGNTNFGVIDTFDTVDHIAVFNLATGVVAVNPTGATAAITSVGGGWYRCSVTCTVSGTNYTVTAGPSSGLDRTSNPASFVYIWGAQLHVGSSVLDYCKTTAAASASGSGFTTTVYDQSGNGRNLLQAVAANQPRIVNAGVIDRIGTRAAIQTDGVSQYLVYSGISLAQPYSRSSVVQFLNPAASGSGRILGNGSDANASLENNGVGNLAMYDGVGPQTVKTGIVANDKATLFETRNGASSSLSYNGSTTTVAASPGTAACTGLSVGAQSTGGLPNSNIYGDIIIFPVALTTSDRLSLEQSQKVYWGTP